MNKHTNTKILYFRITVLCLSAFFLTSCATTRTTKKKEREKKYVCPVETEPILVTPEQMRTSAYHTVAPGETLYRISKMYNVPVELIQSVNGIKRPQDLEVGQKLIIPQASKRNDTVTLYPSKKWHYIVIHHSATDEGSSAKFNAAHKKKGWAGVGYHFVIDNGTCGKSDGQIEMTPRWIKQLDGAHCKAGSMNKDGIGICLVGNFSVDQPSAAQLSSLANLVEQLKTYYKIPPNHIIGHGQVRGAKTECPGKHFPWKLFYQDLSLSQSKDGE
ncbi:MAG TPA: N-acetylmuramoyl-L-alanine amidase [Candidatus Omnitrophota bacterium]|nr:N-acetylmuramoyl-L-alanine amidase [Candidatus Omnitrophota bacterium]